MTYSKDMPTDALVLMLSDLSQEGDLDGLKRLRESGVDMSISSGVAIRKASEFGRTEVVRWLLETCKVDPDLQGVKSLKRAAQNGFADVVELLLPKTDEEREMRFEVPNAVSWAMEQACENGHLAVVEKLWDCYPEYQTGQESALIRASRKGHVDIVKFFLSKGEGVPGFVKSDGLLMSLRHSQKGVAKEFIRDETSDLSVQGYSRVDRAKVISLYEDLKVIVRSEQEATLLLKKSVGLTAGETAQRKSERGL